MNSPSPKSEAMNLLLDVMRQLRDPHNGCPWDRIQTFDTVAPYTIEEAYEVEEAIRNQDWTELREELGDLLLQIVFHAQIAKEQNLFDFEAIAQDISEKMIRRHPHVFGSEEERDVESQGHSWETQKAEERRQKAIQLGETASVLQGIALSLPALMRAQKLSKRASRVGFDWPDSQTAWKKVEEEIGELLEESHKSQTNVQRQQEELGDLLFALCSWARKEGLDAEVALRETNAKFCRRFARVESAVEQSTKDWSDHSLKEMMEFWQESKSMG